MKTPTSFLQGLSFLLSCSVMGVSGPKDLLRPQSLAPCLMPDKSLGLPSLSSPICNDPDSPVSMGILKQAGH